MNILDLPQIAALLGQGPPQPQQQQTAQPIQPMIGDPDQPDINVNSAPSQYRTGIISGRQGNGGAFRPGSLGGNILGALGDAFLVQGGADPVYAPKLEQLRQAEALKGFQADPEGAIGALTQVNPKAGLGLYKDYNNQKNDSAILGLKTRAADQDYQEQIDGHVLSMLGKADAKTYPAILDWTKKYYTRLGLTPSFTLPDQYDPQAIAALRLSGVPVKDQMTIESNDQYRDAMMDYRRNSLEARKEYNQSRIGEASRHNQVTEGIGAENAKSNATRAGASVTSANASATSAQKYKSGGSVSPGTPKKPVYDPNLKKWVLQ